MFLAVMSEQMHKLLKGKHALLCNDMAQVFEFVGYSIVETCCPSRNIQKVKQNGQVAFSMLYMYSSGHNVLFSYNNSTL